MKNIILPTSLFILGIIALTFLFGYINNNKPKIPENPDQVYCIQDVAMCPDGTFVSRVPPDCVFKACSQSSTSTINTGITLAVLQTKQVSTLNITLNKITEDSRCPTDVQCIWEGRVGANITLREGSKSEIIDMYSDHSAYIFNGYKISITDVSPTKTSKHEILQSEYSVTLHIEK